MLNVLRVRTLSWGPVQEEEARPSRVLAAKTRQQLYAYYAKPRSSPYEQIGDRPVISFGFDPNDRTPERLLRPTFTRQPHSTTSVPSSHQDLPIFITPETGPWHMFALLPSVPSSREFESIIASLSDALDF
ncbi:hypothetical protein F5887DRAFT_1283147 [Amanita rubescens]|nr:hypothetical protein F5887DRAFT_1286510 [Amanita rubescens]KAF8344666.1 hypothetical protein F5887DRAFT_1283147 [Amanita rubescens]